MLLRITSLKEFLNANIIDTENYTLSVYSLLLVLVIIIGTVLLLKLIKKIFSGFENKKILDTGSSHSIYQIIRYIIYILVIVLVLESVGINFTAIVAAVTAFAVVLALGVQQLFADWVGGVLLLFEQNLKVGDVVELEDGTVVKIRKINLRTTNAIDRADIHMSIPNSKISNFKIINWSLEEKRTRFQIEVKVAYGSDVEKVKEVLLNCAAEHRAVHGNPEPFVRFIDFGEYSLDFQLFFWSKNTFRIENTKSDIRFAIDKVFRENDIKIPFPQRDIHIS